MDFAKELLSRAEWVKELLAEAGASGVVLGLSGGKDSALAAIICRMATPNVTGIIMPCESKRNYEKDKTYALSLAEKFDVKTLEVDLTPVKLAFRAAVDDLDENRNPMAYANMNPRLRMITLYNYAQRKNYLVCGTGNLSERTMGYFTKWGDGAFDFTPLFFAPAVSIIGGIVVIVTCLLTLGIDISQNRSAFAIFLLADMILFPLMAFMMRFSTGMYMSDSGMGVVGTYDGIPQMIQSLVPADVTSVSIATGVGYRLTWVAAIIMLVDLPEIWSWVHGRRCRRIGTSTDSVSLNIIRDS